MQTMAKDDSDSEELAFILIDASVGPYSSTDEIECWIQELRELPDLPEVKAEIEQATEWLEHSKIVRTSERLKSDKT